MAIAVTKLRLVTPPGVLQLAKAILGAMNISSTLSPANSPEVTTPVSMMTVLDAPRITFAENGNELNR